ncbi:hypothetical protein J4233_05845 [Candidatus Pacearchaeota archaeon]|nr:hypothetical protein [uncultured archaeon]MBS3077759.1 hypothetical protein [Candidatus Pacearchaeota archaeon]
MKIQNKIFLALCAGILVLTLMQSASVSAYTYYDYSPMYGTRLSAGFGSSPYRYGNYVYDYDSSCKYWDNGALKLRTDKVCEWVENGDGWREEVQRARAVVWVTDSYDARYNIQAGRSSGDAFYYHYGDKSATSPSDWRYKQAFDPRIDNEEVMGYNYYYYEPRYDYATQTYNWRF